MFPGNLFQFFHSSAIKRSDAPRIGNRYRKYLFERLEPRNLFAVIDLANLGSAGIFINGERADDVSGFSVSSAGDVNGDGFDDLIVGAYRSNPTSPSFEKNGAGKSYVIFGSSALPATIDLSTLGQAGNPAGFSIWGDVTGD
jgi:hypothetical protein